MAHESFMIVDHSSQAPISRRHLDTECPPPRRYSWVSLMLAGGGADHEDTWTAELLTRTQINPCPLDKGQLGGEYEQVVNKQLLFSNGRLT